MTFRLFLETKKDSGEFRYARTYKTAKQAWKAAWEKPYWMDFIVKDSNDKRIVFDGKGNSVKHP